MSLAIDSENNKKKYKMTTEDEFAVFGCVMRRYPTLEREMEVRMLVKRWHEALVIVGAEK